VEPYAPTWTCSSTKLFSSSGSDTFMVVTTADYRFLAKLVMTMRLQPVS
jgi:hypothetical protein